MLYVAKNNLVLKSFKKKKKKTKKKKGVRAGGGDRAEARNLKTKAPSNDYYFFQTPYILSSSSST